MCRNFIVSSRGHFLFFTINFFLCVIVVQRELRDDHKLNQKEEKEYIFDLVCSFDVDTEGKVVKWLVITITNKIQKENR